MVSEQAQKGFDFIFKKGMTANFPNAFGDVLEIVNANINDTQESEFAVLTISSPCFRLLTLFHFDEKNLNTTRCFLQNTELSVDKPQRAFRDAFLEFCNMCCGAMVRELHAPFHFMGMSTPYTLLSQSAVFISTLKPGFVSHYNILVNKTVVLRATLCVCNYGIVDFKVNTTVVEDNTGELELF